jgi:hypothetical protein
MTSETTKDNFPVFFLVGNDTGYLSSLAILHAARIAKDRVLSKKIVCAFARMSTAAKETGEAIIELSSKLRDSQVLKDDVLIKNARGQANNWSRKNRYQPIYRRSIIS